ncbi:DoxX family protein [Terriglobus sp. RCC_193]|uniref:DoxX family protein n=1 Tax=Terriglobus sp. RCC_193 TaxID=3239218 RepID=UPI0035261140
MTTKSRNITGWVLAGFTFLMLAASAADKIIGSQHALTMGASFGLTASTYRLLGIIEVVSVFLFLLPRTGVLGTLLLASYMGGAIATHLQHQEPIGFPVGIEILIWITAIVRLPELTDRLWSNK